MARRPAKRLKEELNGLEKSTAGRVAASFALPDEFAPLRMRDEYSTEETALFKVNEEHKPNWATAAFVVTQEQLPEGVHLEFLFNDLLRNRITYERNPTALIWNYAWRFGRSVLGSNQLTQQYFKNSVSDMNEISHAVSNGGAWSPHLDQYFACSDKDKKGIWVDSLATALSSIIVTLSVAPAATQGAITLWSWSNGQWVEEATLPLTIAQTVYTFASLGGSRYRNVQLTGGSTDCQFGVVSTGTCGCYGHKYAPSCVVNAPSIESCRILGQSILVRNLASPLNQQGNIVGVQPGKNRPWMSFSAAQAATDPYGVVEDYAGAGASRRLGTGIYGFKKATEQDDFKLKIPFTVENAPGSTTTDWTDADTPITGVEYLVVAMQCNVLAGRDIIVRTVTAGEIETGNPFLQVAKPLAQPNEWRDGMEALASFQQWYENPTHWRQILGTLGRVASVGGRIASLFGGYGRAIGMPVSMAGDLVNGALQ